MEVGMYAQQPTIEEGKWQNPAMQHQVYQLVLSILHHNCTRSVKAMNTEIFENNPPGYKRNEYLGGKKEVPVYIPVFTEGSP